MGSLGLAKAKVLSKHISELTHNRGCDWKKCKQDSKVILASQVSQHQQQQQQRQQQQQQQRQRQRGLKLGEAQK